MRAIMVAFKRVERRPFKMLAKCKSADRFFFRGALCALFPDKQIKWIIHSMKEAIKGINFSTLS